jgi:diguanylate cyclase
MHHGVLLALVAFGLLLFVYMRQKPAGLCALFMATLLLHSFSVGVLQIVAPSPQLTISTAGLSLAAGGVFLLTWLQVAKHASRLIRLTGQVLVTLTLLASLLALLGVLDVATPLATWSGAALMLFLYGLAWRLVFQPLREARYVVLALSVLIPGVVMTYLVSSGVIASTAVNIWAIQIATAVAAPLLAFGLVECRLTAATQALQEEHDARNTEQDRALRLEDLLTLRSEELARARHQIAELSITDDLTGAFNRRHFDRTSASLLAWHNRADPFATCVFEVNDLQAFGEQYGCEARDQALRNVSLAVQSELRRSGDYLFRLDNAAFGVMFTASTPERALQFAERLRGSANSLRLPHTGSPTGVVTLSFGVAWWSVNDVDELTPEQINVEVDKLLTAVRQGEHDGVVMHTA